MVEQVDAATISEEEAARLMGPKIAAFMKDVAEARKRHGIEAYALWMYHHGAARTCSTGEDGAGREIAFMVACMMRDQTVAIFEDVERRMKGEKAQ